jgi:hypothetical protein
MLSVYLETSDTTRHVARRLDYTPCLLRITLKHWVLLLERFLDVDGCPYRRTYLGDLCYAIGLGSLAPLAGFVILVTEEALRVFRLMRRIGGPTRQDRLLLGRPLVLPVAEEIIRDGEARSGRRQSNGACWSQ